jgi:2-iminobutanoate/2-iminopropanoate deaminase
VRVIYFFYQFLNYNDYRNFMLIQQHLILSNETPRYHYKLTQVNPFIQSFFTYIMTKATVISTPKAPAAIGPYNQAIKLGNMVFTSGQIGLNPTTGELVGPGTQEQARQAFTNLKAVAEEAGGNLSNVVKFTLFLTDLSDFGQVNSIMQEFVSAPFAARSTIGVASLPKGARFEVEAIMAL